MLRSAVLLTVWLVAPWWASAQGPEGTPAAPAPAEGAEAPADPIAAAFAKSRTSYESKIEKARTMVLDALDLREAEARSRGDQAAVSRIQGEREAFEADPAALPESTPRSSADYRKAAQHARKAMSEAYGRAVSAYTVAGRDEDARRLKDERALFDREPVVPGAAAPRPRRTVTPPPRRPAPRGPVAMPVVPAGPAIRPLAQGEWRFRYTTELGGANEGAIRVQGTGLRHLDQAHQIGVAYVDRAGVLHMVFSGHRKIPAGEVAATRQLNGYWAGTLVTPSGSLAFELFRR